MSEKSRLLSYIEEHYHYFKNIDINSLDVLKYSSTTELNIMDEYNYLVTPLLKQITNYALVELALGEDEKEVLEITLGSNNIIGNILEFSNCCGEYLKCLLNEGCNHPSVYNFINSAYACNLYNMIVEIGFKLAEVASEEIPFDLLNFCDQVDEKIDEVFLTMVGSVANSSSIDDRKLLSYLSNYTNKIVNILMLFETNKNLYIEEDIVINVLNNEPTVDNNFSFGNVLNELALLIKNTNKYLEFCMDSTLVEQLEKLNEGYLLYMGYRCDYLKKHAFEETILNRCKKK